MGCPKITHFVGGIPANSQTPPAHFALWILYLLQLGVQLVTLHSTPTYLLRVNSNDGGQVRPGTSCIPLWLRAVGSGAPANVSWKWESVRDNINALVRPF